MFNKALPIGPVNNQPKYYSAKFNIKKVGDTYLDLSTWGKGLVWVNGHCIGRYWNVGPQQTLYLPGCWLKKGENEILILDITGPAATTTKGVNKPNVSELHKEFLPKDAIKYTGRPKATNATVDAVGNDAAPGAK